MAVTITGNTQLAATKAELISNLAQRELRFAAKLLPLFTDYSRFAVKGVSQIGAPRLASFTVQERPSGVDGDVTTLLAAKDVIPLDKNLYVSWIVDAADEIQSSLDVQAEYIARAASAHGRKIDELLIATMRAVAVDEGNAPATYAQLLTLITNMKKADADMSQAALIVSPAQVQVLLGLNEFKSAEFYGSTPIATGQVGRILGVPVIEHNGLVDAEYYLVERSGIGYAFQQAPNVAEQPAIAYGTTAKQVALDQKFGCAGLQIGEKAAGAGKSPLVRGIFGV